jgi:hypothetical protein
MVKLIIFYYAHRILKIVVVPAPTRTDGVLIDNLLADVYEEESGNKGVIFEGETTAVNSSNITFPDSIRRLGAGVGPVDVVSNPSKVALNGGEVSVGGQQSCLSPESPVTVKFAPATKARIVGVLMTILPAGGAPLTIVPLAK